MKAILHPIRPLLRVPVVDLRAAMTVKAEEKGDLVQIPDHGCPPPNQYQTIGAAIAGAIMTAAAWFRETLFPAWSTRRKEWEDYKSKVDKLEGIHDREEQERLIKTKVQEELALALKQRATENR